MAYLIDGKKISQEIKDELKERVAAVSYTHLDVYKRQEMLRVINYSKQVFFEDKKNWNKMVDRGMAKDFSWKNSAKRYEDVYNYLIGV